MLRLEELGFRIEGEDSGLRLSGPGFWVWG